MAILTIEELRHMKQTKNNSSLEFLKVREKKGSARNSRGLWKRLGEKGRENIQMVASLEKQTKYTTKRYPYARFIRANTNRLLKRNFDKQMIGLKKYLRTRKIRKFRRINYA